VEAYSAFVFENVDPGFASRAAAARDAGSHNVIVAGRSYGQGSSREHAAICPGFLGVKAVLAKSFERIHAANLVNFGILPLTFADDSDYDRVEAGDRFEIAGARRAIAEATRVAMRDATKGFDFEVEIALSSRERAILLAGGACAAVAFAGGKGKGGS
jgi:aconitate hydratase